LIVSKRINMNTVIKNILAMFLLTIFLVFSSLDLNLTPLLVSPLIIAILIIYPTKSKAIKVIGFVYSLFFLFLIKVNLIRFDFIPQAQVLLENNESVFYWFSIGHVHAIRLLVAYPGYLISEIYSVDLDTGFTYYGMILFIFIFLNIANTISKLQSNKGKIPREIRYLILLVPLLVLPLIMNGRLILSYLGYSILVNLYTDLISDIRVKKTKVILMTLFGVVMTMVSSGTMVVAILYVIAMLYAINYSKFNKKKFLKSALIFLLILSPLIYKVIDYAWLMINRNIVFYSGGIQGFVNMLNHGLGKYFSTSTEILLFLLIFATGILILNYKFLKNKIIKRDKSISIVLGVNIAVYGLLFGFSTGLMMIPPLLIYILIRL